ncbi:HlyD family efflux transporter periplasmic adaptor subunit [uncultured Desulfobacter sp.]|uniref:HlyD family efflux transporter periplasmic adaptor subunit n=1 Tax=uncultured Desulfobacter sp. TaxID=240139 RepID=UPI0029F4D1F9|nr:HlyD family efflux transporter periplasmic adaptor subunit [uncultured Desulfobacter sp.]
MLSDGCYPSCTTAQDTPIRLETFHTRRFSPLIWVLFLGLLAFSQWAFQSKIDQVARARGEVIASSRVQVLQAVDGGVLTKLNVKEGDRVEAGQELARLDQTKLGAAVLEIEARLAALNAKAARLKAEVSGQSSVKFSKKEWVFPEIVRVEKALFKQRKSGFAEEIRTLKVEVRLSGEEFELIRRLSDSGDVNRSEVIRTERALNDAQAKLINRKNKFLEDARIELTGIEDKIAQNDQILTQRKQQLADCVFKAPIPGIVKNIRVTTVGGVLRGGEELMQLVPVNDRLIVESKVSPADIAQIRNGLDVTIRFDPFDYTIFGVVKGKVVYVSADTLKEKTPRGEEIYYRVHVSTQNKSETTTGRKIDILPGMTAQLDIRIGERTLMNFLLKPVRKTLSQSFKDK